ncbi:MAG: hypothetical protein PHG29_06525 [Prolixibacteraceae bacterium]|nr:hypothetical protein [Prolixibacteraceae bacterium]
MKTKGLLLIVIPCLAMILAAGCATPVTVAGNYTYKTECLGKELDGSQILKAWGSGKTRTDATEMAMKNAVNDVLFKGIIDGVPGCDLRPIITDVNARQKYAYFFNSFFAEKGEYLNYVEKRDKLIHEGDLKQTRTGMTAGVIVRVNVEKLKEKMALEGIVKYY